MKLFLHVHTRDRNYKPVMLRMRDAWEESKHPRGQPDNPGQFTSGGGSSSKSTASEQRSEAPQERPASESKSSKSASATIPSELKNHATQYQDDYWTFEPSGDRYMSQHYNIDAPNGSTSASLVLSQESPDWHLYLLDAPPGKENIFGRGQDKLEQELIKQGFLSGPSPAKIKLPPGYKPIASAKTKATFGGRDREEDATGYTIIDNDGYRTTVLISDESDAWKTVASGFTHADEEGHGQEALNNALNASNISAGKRKPKIKPDTGSEADQVAAHLSNIRVGEIVNRYEHSRQTASDKEEAYRDVAHTVMQYMHIHPSVGLRVEPTHKFKIGNAEYESGGSFNPMNNTITICTNNGITDKLAGLAAHESMHAKFDAIGRAYRREVDRIRKLDYDSQDKVIAPDGSIREEYKDQYPLHYAMPMGFGIVKGSSRDKLEEDDGITDYSRAYWEAVKTGGARGDPLLATNETLSEMARLDREGSLPRLLWYKNSKTYKPLYKLIHEQYPYATEIMND